MLYKLFVSYISIDPGIQSGPEKIFLKTIDSFVVKSIFCEPLCIIEW